MANRLQRLLYFLSAEAPVLIVFAVILFLRNSTLDNWRSCIIPGTLIIFAIFLIIIFNYSFKFAKNNLPVISININLISNDEGWLVGYVLTYLLPLVSFNIDAHDKYTVGAVIILFVLVMLLSSFSDYVTPHPLLFLKGYHFYEINVIGAQGKMKLVSDKRLRKATDVKNVKRLFENLLIRV